MSGRPVVLLLPLLAFIILTSCSASSLPNFVVKLEDHSFEHATQASTGQTTGIWFVLLSNGSDASHALSRALWEQLAAEEDRTVIYAAVNSDANILTRWRFEEFQPEEQRHLPLALLLRNRKLFVYPGPVEGDAAATAVVQFALEGYQSAEAQEVPAPRVSAVTDPKAGWDMITIGGTVLSFVMFEVGRHFIDRDRQRRLARQAADAAAAAHAAAGTDPAPAAATTSDKTE